MRDVAAKRGPKKSAAAATTPEPSLRSEGERSMRRNHASHLARLLIGSLERDAAALDEQVDSELDGHAVRWPRAHRADDVDAIARIERAYAAYLGKRATSLDVFFLVMCVAESESARDAFYRWRVSYGRSAPGPGDFGPWREAVDAWRKKRGHFEAIVRLARAIGLTPPTPASLTSLWSRLKP
jgi:phage baseplate assembly protein W